MTTRMRTGLVGALLATLWVGLSGCAPKEPLPASQDAAALDQQIDWTYGKLIAVQEGMRYKTLDSFARESLSRMTGREHLPGLSPMASLMEWLFNRNAYVDEPVIKVKKDGVRLQLARQMPAQILERVRDDKYFSPREIQDPRLLNELQDMRTQNIRMSAVNQVMGALAMVQRMEEFVLIVPQPGGDEDDPWYSPANAMGNLTDAQLAEIGVTRASLPPQAQQPIPGLTPEQALGITLDWSGLRAGWLAGDAEKVQKYVDRLAGRLPPLAADGVYPDRSQRSAEARYYASGKFTYGWMVYFLGMLLAVPTLLSQRRASWGLSMILTPWGLTMILLIAGVGLHAYGLSLRWYILGRVPVANMFEAVVASACIAIIGTILIELWLRTHIFPLAAHIIGFLALVMGGSVLPGSELSSIPGILDDIQLRIHTVLIISAYALIAVAAVIAVLYLLGYYGFLLERLVTREPLQMVAGSGTFDQRPILAGAAPGDDSNESTLPQWLNNLDWSHLIVLNMVFVLLFVGTILGAWWADYSWGRPWGWDPKEVFALNTWLIYAILLHMRFVVKHKGIWTAWLSIIGFGMMAFNWFFVNFFISSIHSYA